MRPSKKHMKVDRYVDPSEFERWKKTAEDMGFLYVASGPLVRSSYKAGEFFITNVLNKRREVRVERVHCSAGRFADLTCVLSFSRAGGPREGASGNPLGRRRPPPVVDLSRLAFSLALRAFSPPACITILHLMAP